MKYAKLLIVLSITSITFSLQAQKKIEDLAYYEASNGITYKEGDRVKMSHGSADFKNFKSVSEGKGSVPSMGSTQLSAVYSNYIFTIKAIKRYNLKRYKGIIFYVDGFPIYGGSLEIESAIENCEIYDCDGATQDFVFDESFKSKKNSEKINEYKASNGVTYNIDDEITLNKGSSRNGDFVFLTDSKNGIMEFEERLQSNGKRMGETVVIKKIVKYNTKNMQGIYFSVNVTGRVHNSILDIEGAIYSCEIGYCEQKEEITIKEKEVINKDSSTLSSTQDKFDLLRELKKLHDEGILTDEEYSAEKKKILKKEH